MIIQCNLLTIKNGIIGHQVNCKGVMGAGLALQIKNAYPEAFELYKKACMDGRLTLGKMQLIQLTDNLYLANLAGQDGYGKGLQTNYDALKKALISLHELNQILGSVPYLPYNMGCGLAGGDWSIVEDLIYEHCPRTYICKL